MDDKKKDLAQALKDDFRVFLIMLWKFLKLPEPNELQLDIAYTVQHGPTKMILQAYRGAAKSWITAAYVLWRLYRNPHEKIMVVSANQDRADQFSIFVKQILNENPLLSHLKPRFGQRNSNKSFDVGPAKFSQAPSVKSVGIEGQLTGSRASIIIADDIEIPKNSMTVDKREKIAELTKEFSAVIADAKDYRIIYLGTPQVEETLYDKLMDRGFTKYIYPARYPSEKQMRNYKGDLGNYIQRTLGEHKANAPVDPWRFPEELLLEKEADYGRSGFQLQYMLDTSLSDAEKYPLKLSDLIVMPLDHEQGPSKVMWSNDPNNILKELPSVGFTGDRYYRNITLGSDVQYVPYTEIVMVIDPSGRGKDHTGYVILAYINAQLFLLDAGGLEGGYDDETLIKLSEKAAYYNVNRVIIEANFGDGMYTKLFEPVLHKQYKCTVEEVKHSIQKEVRIIDTLEPVMNRHKLIVNYDVIKNDTKYDNRDYQLFYQMTRITKERGSLRHDDVLDALAIAVGYFSDKMNRDTEKMREMASEEARERELLEFINRYDEQYSTGNVNYIANWV